MARLLKADGVTHLHCHFANHPALAGYIVHELAGIPYSFTAHGSDLHVDRRMLCEKVEAAAFVVAISEFNRDVIVKECGAAAGTSVRVIHTGVDTDHFRPHERPSRVGVFEIICVGTLHEVKGQEYLVRACERLARAGVDFRCRFVGAGADRSSLERQVEAAGLSANVVFEGSIDRAALGVMLQTANVLVAPSVPTREGKREGIPVVLMEAMASGLPVIASRLSGIPELVEDGRSGLLVEPRDDASIAEALLRLRDNDELRAQLGREGRRKVMAEFDIRVNAKRLAAAFAGTERSAV
jgi:glycosyltransferase involved in cell wall biosynthesis